MKNRIERQISRSSDDINFSETIIKELSRKQFNEYKEIGSKPQKARLTNDRTQEFSEITLDGCSGQAISRGLFHFGNESKYIHAPALPEAFQFSGQAAASQKADICFADNRSEGIPNMRPHKQPGHKSMY